MAREKQKQPVWEITGAEFTNQGVHTADGISIRFPRVTRIRHDKDWSTATNLDELRDLFQRKPESVDFDRLLGTLVDIKNVKKHDPTNISPKKNESAKTDSWDAPSTSSKVKEELMDVKEEVKGVPLSESILKRRKGDKCDDGSSDKAQSGKKKAKVKREIKGEQDLSSTRFKKEGRSDSGIEQQKEDHFASGTEGSFESSFDVSVSNSDNEDTVSN